MEFYQKLNALCIEILSKAPPPQIIDNCKPFLNSSLFM